ncbi:hypothetical protein C0Q70_14758 [Pomacea canaliculata]|uniref:Uncharacterized protein n=2 Tax=Pomacea canaliculata TaxID=400727 RepID=A0A2T7NSY1_POMCA|nr:hypothetical protein C0Q70_14758 [Pomacea canaliculata]
MDKWAGNEGRPMSEQMMKEYFRQLKQTICSNLVEEKFIDELVIRNVKSCSFYDQFSNVKLATNRQGSDGQSSDMPPIHHHCSAADGEAKSLKTNNLEDTGGSCGAFQAADEPKATNPDTK